LSSKKVKKTNMNFGINLRPTQMMVIFQINNMLLLLEVKSLELQPPKGPLLSQIDEKSKIFLMNVL